MRELGVKWAAFAVVWTTSLAYIIAVAFYQTFSKNNLAAAMLSGMISCLVFVVFTYLVKSFVCKKYTLDQSRLIPSKIV
jgi:chromate transport protein ChrA